MLIAPLCIFINVELGNLHIFLFYPNKLNKCPVFPQHYHEKIMFKVFLVLMFNKQFVYISLIKPLCLSSSVLKLRKRIQEHFLRQKIIAFHKSLTLETPSFHFK